MGVAERVKERHEREVRLGKRPAPVVVRAVEPSPEQLPEPVESSPATEVIDTNNKPVESLDDEWARSLVEDGPPPIVPRPKVARIQRIVCEYYRLSHNDLISHAKTASVFWPRQVAVYLCRRLTLHTHSEIGRRFNGREHSTVVHAVKKVTAARAANPDLDRELTHLEARIMDGVNAQS